MKYKFINNVRLSQVLLFDSNQTSNLKKNLTKLLLKINKKFYLFLKLTFYLNSLITTLYIKIMSFVYPSLILFKSILSPNINFMIILTMIATYHLQIIKNIMIFVQLAQNLINNGFKICLPYTDFNLEIFSYNKIYLVLNVVHIYFLLYINSLTDNYAHFVFYVIQKN